MKRFVPIRMAVWTAVALMACTAGRAGEKLTYTDLIRRMTDLEHLAVLPEAGETCAQWSSYDRTSKYDAATDKYIGWDANGDGVGIIRSEGDQVVLAEMEGPGCIWRIWSAAAGDGHVRIYSRRPGEAGRRSGRSTTTSPASRPRSTTRGFPTAWSTFGYRGQNLYFPIPYQKSCKIVADKDWGNYYHFVYATYPAGNKRADLQGRAVGGRGRARCSR